MKGVASVEGELMERLREREREILREKDREMLEMMDGEEGDGVEGERKLEEDRTLERKKAP
jgi:hypothetical protein